MAHGGYEKRRGAAPAPARRPANTHRSKALAVDQKSKVKAKPPVTLKRQIRSTERLLRKDTRPDVKEALEKKLEGLKKQQDNLNRLAVEKKIFLRYRMIKFFERRKIERNIRRLEKQQRSSSGQAQEAEIAGQLSKLKEDLEYIRFFPKNEKYLSLFKGVDDADIIEKRNKLRKQIKDNIVAAVASGKDLEETGSEDDGLLDLSDDDFFLSGSSSDEADADDEWTDKSTREQASSASGKVTSGMSSDEKNQKQISARTLMPPPRLSNNSNSSHAKKWPSKNSNPGNRTSKYVGKPRYEGPLNNSNRKPYARRDELSTSSTSNTSNSFDRSTFKRTRPLEPPHTGNSSNLSSNSDARKPKRKRRPKKKKQQA